MRKTYKTIYCFCIIALGTFRWSLSADPYAMPSLRNYGRIRELYFKRYEKLVLQMSVQKQEKGFVCQTALLLACEYLDKIQAHSHLLHAQYNFCTEAKKLIKESYGAQK